MAPKKYEFYFTKNELKYKFFKKKKCLKCNGKMNKISDNEFIRKDEYILITVNGKQKYKYRTIGKRLSYCYVNSINDVPDIYKRVYYYECRNCKEKFSLSFLAESAYSKEVNNNSETYISTKNIKMNLILFIIISSIISSVVIMVLELLNS